MTSFSLRAGFGLLSGLLPLLPHTGLGQSVRRLVPQQYAAVQAAIDAAQPGDTVLVAPGCYYENLRFNGHNVTVASTWLLDRRNLNLIRQTILDGSRPVVADTASVVRFIDGETTAAQLMGFTLTAGSGALWKDPHSAGKFREGGAILMENVSPTIAFNIMTSNSAKNVQRAISAGGGGMRIDGGEPRILNNVIVVNRGRYGAGVVLNYAGG